VRLLVDTHCWLWNLLAPGFFDRILIAQAQTEELQFMTADKVLTAYAVPILWAGV
jgi:PIN domain nuclease of toxin-antitoxin system